MNKVFILFAIFFCHISNVAYAQDSLAKSTIYGHVVDAKTGEHLLFAAVAIEGTTLGTITDETGHFVFQNLSRRSYTVTASYLGYKQQTMEVTLNGSDESKHLHFNLEPDVLGLSEVVVTGDRNQRNRRESSTIITTINTKTFNISQSLTLADGLNFSPGLRVEDNCQNCGFSQVRMNGMEGPYSQILINSRPIFSGLAGVYGLELIPTSIIERVEVIRGGGSALYGSNAIAGTINLILRDPIANSWEAGINSSLTGLGMNSPTPDLAANFNTSLISDDFKSGLTLYAFLRNRQPFDANNDGYSEISLINNYTVGSRFFVRTTERSKLTLDFFNIHEKRRGGDKFDLPLHESNISEAVEHNITTIAASLDRYLRKTDKLSLYASAQRINRDSYYGANQALNAYGNTKDLTFNAGTQYNAKFNKSSLLVGMELTGSHLDDQKLGYIDAENPVFNPADSTYSYTHIGNTTIANQTMTTYGIYSQYEIKIRKVQLSAGFRLDNYTVNDLESTAGRKSGCVVSPRFTAKYDPLKNLQLRLTFSQGYRAPQIFDEDLHIETSGSRQVMHVNDPNLKQENSNSFMASIDYTKEIKKQYFGFLIEAFYTQLQNPFSKTYSAPDSNGLVTSLRINAKEGAVVQGVNIELSYAPNRKITLKSGFTLQSSKYEVPQDFDEKKFLRTPDNYGFFTFDYSINKKLAISATGNYTGSMLVAYFGPIAADPEVGELHKTTDFFDLGFKIRHTIPLTSNKLQLFAGVRNIFNAYQSDFDAGINRDPGYVYGPMNPRTIYFGLKISNL